MKSAVNKVERLLSRRTSRKVLPELEQSLVSFGFDDCPASAIETGLPMLEAEGWNATIYVACGLCETENHLGRHMSLSDIVDVHSRGHEIADHTYSHLSIHEVGTPDYLADIEKNQKALKALGVAESRHFAYPYGHVSPELKRALGQQFKTMRGVVPSNAKQQDANLLSAVRIYSGDDLKFALKKIIQAKTEPRWLNLFTHDVRENPSNFGCTPEDFRMVVDAVKDAGLHVMTVDAAYQKIDKGGSTT